MAKKQNLKQLVLGIFGGLIILGISIATLVFDVIPFVWIGGFILAGYIFFRTVNPDQKENKEEDEKIEIEFDTIKEWKEKAKNEQDLKERMQEIFKKYGAGHLFKYLLEIEKFPSEKISEIVWDVISGPFTPNKKKQGAIDNPCKDCDGFGIIIKTRRGILGNSSQWVTCPKCDGTGVFVSK